MPNETPLDILAKRFISQEEIESLKSISEMNNHFSIYLRMNGKQINVESETKIPYSLIRDLGKMHWKLLEVELLTSYDEVDGEQKTMRAGFGMDDDHK